MPRFNLRSKLSISFLLILLPLLALVAYTYRVEDETWTNAVLEDQAQTAQAIAALTDAKFDQAFAFAWAVENDPLVRMMDAAQLDSHLQQLQSNYPQYMGVSVHNAAGDLVGVSSSWSPEIPRERDAANVPYLEQVLETGQPAISPVLPARRNFPGDAFVGVAVPIRDGAGNTVGVVSVSIPLESLSSQLQSMTLSPAQNIILTDPKGTAALITGLPSLAWEQRDLSGFSPIKSALQGSASKPRNLSIPFSSDNRMGGFVQSPKYGWVVGVTEREDVALTPVWSGLRDWLLGLAGVTVLSAILIMFLSNRLVQPIRDLAAQAQRLGRGDLAQKVRIETGDELEDLGGSFNQMAEEIRAHQKELEQRATELEMANQELESFTYSVSHDLRTPLASIDGFSRILQDDCGAQLPPFDRRYLGLIRSGITQMDELITSLLALSRLSRQPLKKQRINMKQLVTEAVDAVRPAGERKDSIEVLELPDADADPVLLKQVWVNLIANAVKFTRNSKDARVEVGGGQWLGDSKIADHHPLSTVHYFVRDNGVGFDMEQAEKLFGVFQRLHSAEEYEGNGVGLAIVARIVRRHGGRVWAEGEVGKGATFYFTLG